MDVYENVDNMVLATDPHLPVYCIYRHVYRESTQHFLEGFPGRVLFAVKANNHPKILAQLFAAGVRHFDCASLEEIKLVDEACPGSKMYFMNPVRLAGHARAAQMEYGVRHFVIDHHSGLAPLLDEIDVSQPVIFARMAVEHE